jgi:hypothetical protein
MGLYERAPRKQSKKGGKKNRRKANERQPHQSLQSYQPVNTFKEIPQTLKVRLRRREWFSTTSTAVPIYTAFGLLEPVGQIPSYLTQLMGPSTLYKRARIHASTITCTLVNVGSEPLLGLTAIAPYNTTTGGSSVTELVDKPHTVHKIASGVTGMDRVSWTNSVSSRTVLGKDAYLSDFDFDYTQATNSSPIQADEPGWLVVISNFNGAGNVSYRLEVVLEWDVEFFDTTTP